MPTRLLVVLPSLRGGGVERFVETLLPGLDRSRVLPTLGLLHRIDEADYAAGIPENVPIVDFHKSSALDLPFLVRRITRYLDAERPDVVMGVMTYQNLMILAARRLSRHRPRVIVTEHMNPDALARSVRRRWQLLLARRLYPEAMAVVCVSDGQRDGVVRHFRLSPERVVRIYNGSNRKIAKPIAAHDLPGWPAVGPVIVFAGHLSEVKGVVHLVEAMPMVRRRVPARLMLLGDGDQRQQLEGRVAELGLGDAVHFLGHVPDPTPYLAAADVVAVPSLSEALGLTVIEAARGDWPGGRRRHRRRACCRAGSRQRPNCVARRVRRPHRLISARAQANPPRLRGACSALRHDCVLPRLGHQADR
jgi:glycosyltransferase involved in cell wall biosynthesis